MRWVTMVTPSTSPWGWFTTIFCIYPIVSMNGEKNAALWRYLVAVGGVAGRQGGREKGREKRGGGNDGGWIRSGGGAAVVSHEINATWNREKVHQALAGNPLPQFQAGGWLGGAAVGWAGLGALQRHFSHLEFLERALGRRWEVLGGVGWCWEVLGGVGRCWEVLGGISRG